MFRLTQEQIDLMTVSELEQYTKNLSDQIAYNAEDSLFAFYRDIAWPAVEGNRQFLDNWHLHVLAEHLEAVSRGDIRRLVINVPFRTSKSILTSVAWPAWSWIRSPGKQWLCGSYAEHLAVRDAVKMRRVVTSPLFQKYWGDKFSMSTDQNQKQKFENDVGGYRQAFGITAGVMGSGGDILLLDDPQDRDGANSDAERESTITTFSEGVVTRLNDPKTSPIVLIMQRLHQNDLSGFVLKDPEWEHLMLPMRYESGRRCKTSLGYADQRTVEGDLLWPERFPEETVASLERTLGNYGAAGQLAQRPAPEGGGILKTAAIKIWPADKALPDLSFIVQSYDTAFTIKTDGDPTGCQVWGIFEQGKKRQAILLDCWNERLAYPQLKERMASDWTARYAGVKNDVMKPSRRPDMMIVENKGSGISVIQDMRQSGIPAIPYNPGRADKMSRAHMAAPFLENEMFWVMESPKFKGKPRTWVQPFFDQLEQFPNGSHDEMVDTLTQFVIWARDSGQLDLTVEVKEEITEIDYEETKKVRHRVNPYG